MKKLRDFLALRVSTIVVSYHSKSVEEELKSVRSSASKSMNLGLRKQEVLRIHKENKRLVTKLQHVKSEVSGIMRPKTQQLTERKSFKLATAERAKLNESHSHFNLRKLI